MPYAKGLCHQLARSWVGTLSASAGLAVPLGGWWWPGGGGRPDPARLAAGLAVVLPGVEGRGPLNGEVCQGLLAGGFPGAVLLWDWTTGLWPLLLYHLRAAGRNRRQAQDLAQFVVSYQDAYPGRPVYLLGHSGGAAVATWALEALPAGRAVTGAVLLGAALSAAYPLGPVLTKVERGLWNFWSPLDLFFLGACTLLFGTIDGRHVLSAGLCGFTTPDDAGPAEQELYRDRLHQHGYGPRWLCRFHLGGHFGWANRVFVAEAVTPLLAGRPVPAAA